MLRSLPLVFLTSLLYAAPVTYNIGKHNSRGFSASYVHSAVGRMTVDGTDYYPSGRKLASVSGPLNGNLNGNVLTILPSVLELTGRGVRDLVLNILGGRLEQGSNGTEGHINYEFTNGRRSIGGTFFFFADDFPGLPNELSSGRLALWGNNWDNKLLNRSDVKGPKLGLDLYGEAPQTPEPTSLMLVGLGFASIAIRRRLCL